MKKKIYTRTGDSGDTSLFSGQRVPKNNSFIEALGTVDECNCAIGMALAEMPKELVFSPYRQQLIAIQHALFDLGAAIATPRTQSQPERIEKTRFDQEAVDQLEKWIDEIQGKLPELHTFILPGGHPVGAQLHLARSICRRAERTIAPLNNQKDVSDRVIRFLNRLSDYLFVISRAVNHLADVSEVLWHPHQAKESLVK